MTQDSEGKNFSIADDAVRVRSVVRANFAEVVVVASVRPVAFSAEDFIYGALVEARNGVVKICPLDVREFVVKNGIRTCP